MKTVRHKQLWQPNVKSYKIALVLGRSGSNKTGDRGKGGYRFGVAEGYAAYMGAGRLDKCLRGFLGS